MAAPQPKRVAAASRREAVRLGHLLHTPNLVTLCRLLSIPFLMVLLSKHRFHYALYLFAAAAMTDALDGTVARWFDAKSELGAFLDPFADKLLLLSTFVALTIYQLLPSWLLAVVVIRDIVIVFGYFMLTFFIGDRIPVRPSYLGKASTFLQLACVLVVLAQINRFFPLDWQALLYVTVAATGLSGLQYMYRGLVLLSSREPEMFA
ncbi:MAG: CDP-alcohol phosphatidyltransferase family protein [Candidatus Binataceae bacterium]